MTDQDRPVTVDEPLPLPGLGQQPARGMTEMEAAVRRTLAALHQQGHVQEVDAGKAQLALEMARSVARKNAPGGRASTIGNDARVLMEILDAFVDDASDVDDDLRAAMDEWKEEVGVRDATTEVRDGP